MKRRIPVAITVFLLIFTGCGKAGYPDLPKDAIAFEMGRYIDESNDGDSYATIEYEGRTYMSFGTIGKPLRAKEIGTCLGYPVQDGKELTEIRIFTLAEDTEHNYLMSYDTVGIMEQPSFWRAVVTSGKEIDTPGFIHDLGYAFWNNS